MKKQFVLCIDSGGYPESLEKRKFYELVEDADAAKEGLVRVIDESGEDYLYPVEYFVVIEVPRQSARVLTKSFTRRDKRAA